MKARHAIRSVTLVLGIVAMVGSVRPAMAGEIAPAPASAQVSPEPDTGHARAVAAPQDGWSRTGTVGFGWG